MAEYGKEIPEVWRQNWKSWKERLALNWSEIQRLGGPDRKLARKIAEGEIDTARIETLSRMTRVLPIDDIDKVELLGQLGIQGLQRSFRAISVNWEGRFASFGDHANRILDRVGLRTREEYQMVANIGLPRIESIARGVLAFGPQNAANLPL